MSSWGVYFNYWGRSFDQAPTLSLRGPAQFTQEARSDEFTDGWVDGFTEYQKCPSIFFILCWYIDHVYVYLSIYSQKLSPTFFWVSKFDVKLRSGGIILKLQFVHDFLIIIL